MKIKLGILVQSHKELKELAKTNPNILVGVKIKEIMKAVESHLEIYEKVRVEKIKELGVKKDDNTYEVKKENVELFKNELNKLFDSEKELDIKELKVSELKKSNGELIDFGANNLIALDWLIKT